MIEPKVVFCKNNHIYDSAINAECPYCLSIKKEQRKLNKFVAEKGELNIGSIDENEDVTEMIKRVRSNEETDEDNHDVTELIDCSDKARTSYLVGWLVAINGKQKGHSIEIVEGRNLLYQNQEMVMLKTDGLGEEKKLGILHQDKNDREFYICPELEVECRVNGIKISEIHVLKPYDTIEIQKHNFVFVKLNSKKIEWGI